ncbi:MAG: LacI family transcriptional regulator [Erysipelothrix sp.]|nr:LacI family transcriptional regulator [Erysipelothrix sp.]
MKRVTIYDVAKEANVSLATVSRVINSVDVVRKDTRERVEAAIKRLGYKPNAIAQGLALSKTTTIGLVVPEASFTFTGNVINGLLDVARIYKYNIMLNTTTEGISEISDIIESIIKSRVDGVVIYNDKMDYSMLKELTNYDIPIVIINNKVSDEKLSSVYIDIARAVYEKVDEYIKTGRKKIGIIQDRKNNFACQLMIDGAKKAYEENGLSFDGFIQIPGTYRTSYDFLSDHLKEERYDLLLAYRDSQAFAAVNAAEENGLSVPNDLEIICIIDTKYNSMVRPRISSFSIPSYDLGAVAMRVLTKMLKNDDAYEHEIELNYLYTERESTKPAKK